MDKKGYNMNTNGQLIVTCTRVHSTQLLFTKITIIVTFYKGTLDSVSITHVVHVPADRTGKPRMYKIIT